MAGPFEGVTLTAMAIMTNPRTRSTMMVMKLARRRVVPLVSLQDLDHGLEQVLIKSKFQNWWINTLQAEYQNEISESIVLMAPVNSTHYLFR